MSLLSDHRASRKLRRVLASLHEAMIYAKDTGSDRWDFALPIECVYALRANESELRWLVRKGYIAHAKEITTPDEHKRVFRPICEMTFCSRTCFILTDTGADAMGHETLAVVDGRSSLHECKCVKPTVVDNPARPVEAAIEPADLPKLGLLKPNWDGERRLLTLGGATVKYFRWTAANQEAILAAFQEEGWPARIDDPLPPQDDQESKRRLSDTIKCLNRKQARPLLRFRGDGTGEGIVWQATLAHPPSYGRSG